MLRSGDINAVATSDTVKEKKGKNKHGKKGKPTKKKTGKRTLRMAKVLKDAPKAATASFGCKLDKNTWIGDVPIKWMVRLSDCVSNLFQLNFNLN